MHPNPFSYLFQILRTREQLQPLKVTTLLQHMHPEHKLECGQHLFVERPRVVALAQYSIVTIPIALYKSKNDLEYNFFFTSPCHLFGLLKCHHTLFHRN